MACHSLEKTRVDPLCLPTSSMELKNSLPDLNLNPGRRASSARQASRHCGLFNGLAHCATKTDSQMGSTNLNFYSHQFDNNLHW